MEKIDKKRLKSLLYGKWVINLVNRVKKAGGNVFTALKTKGNVADYVSVKVPY